MDATAKKTSFTPFLLVGLIAGASLAYLNQLHHPTYLPYVWIIFYGLMFLIAYPCKRSLVLLLISTTVPSLLASIPFISELSLANMPVSVFFLGVISAYALNAFHIYFHQSEKNYQTLFFAVWDTFIKLSIAFIFTLICWIILFLCSALFKIIGIGFFNTLLSRSWFEIGISAVFMSIGLYITTQTHHIIQSIRVILLLICQYLFVPLAMIGILFIITLIVKEIRHPQPLSNEFTFLAIAFLSVFFTNGVYQSGLSENPYPAFLCWICRIFLWITPFFALMALYAIYQHGDHCICKTGLNRDNFFFLISAALVLVYSISYAVIALLGEKPYFRSIEKTNILLAIFLIFVTLITTNPWVITKIPAKQYSPAPPAHKVR